ncbi:MAG: DUF2142 domain-containing protein [Thermodesulfobacteriota bacterium]
MRGRRATLSPSLAFLAIALPAGAILAVVSQPLRWGDENTHLLQAYALSEGTLRPELRGRTLGVGVPRAVQGFIIAFAKHHLKRSLGTPSWEDVGAARSIHVTRHRGFAKLAVFTYSPVGYLPQAAGIALARTFTDSVLLQLYAARLANLAVWAALVSLALRVTPVLALPLAVLALAPMSVFLAASCAADATTNGLAFLWFASVLRLAVGEREPDAPPARAWLALSVQALLLSLAKIAYTPLLLLLLLVPADRLGGRRRATVASVALVTLGVLAVVVWLALVRTELAQSIAYRGQSHAAANLAALAEHPGRFLQVLASTVHGYGGRWLRELGGTTWTGPAEPRWLVWLWGVALAIAVVVERRPAGWPRLRERAVALVASALCLTGVVLAAYLFWTAGGHPTATGVQGRYLIPLLPPLLLALLPPARLRLRAGAPALRLAALALVAWALGHTILRTLSLYQPVPPDPDEAQALRAAEPAVTSRSSPRAENAALATLPPTGPRATLEHFRG